MTQTDRRFPRRVAFARDNNNQLVTASASSPYQPMGVGCPVRSTAYTTPAVAAEYQTNGCSYVAGNSPVAGTNYGVTGNNGLWYRTVNLSGTISSTSPSTIANATYASNRSLFYYPPVDIDGNGTVSGTELTGQPILVPVTQVTDASAISGNLRGETGTGSNTNQNEFRNLWINISSGNTTYNATFVIGNSPSRQAEVSAGLQNFVRFLESWNNINARISGSFIQLQRSRFATAPISTVLAARNTTVSTVATNLSIFDYPLDTYPTGNGDGILPYYWAPSRTWGFDVGLLSEQPDLLPNDLPNPKQVVPASFLEKLVVTILGFNLYFVLVLPVTKRA
ncbi:MAG: hypothetical protein HC903_30805 [Methylacidiphilales bacterium]|nr:hypothetical protein [Candidatus Methylacidiphilales bacterium]